ncbi:hypothetical protein C1645_837573 [Glomus cerebriforme]|uniref:Uncharacterized protein n=1 Tax=Glomus cerebriforme TaxID=658196 RepID=A0A397SAP7_9GLOM|nr:hypothetical protein C1645_837573 [Glomus cerebriforme]
MGAEQKKKKLIMKEFYSKVCVVESIKFFADELSESEINLTKTDKFTCNLATILAARDKEVVASLNKALESDNLANLWIKVYEYCSDNLESRFQKLKNYITTEQHHDYVSAFIKYASIDIKNIDKMERSLISIICCCFYKKVKDDPTIPKKFLGRIKRSHIVLHLLKPVAVNQSIFSWKNIIQRFTNEYESFKEDCSNDFIKMKKLKYIYDEIDKLDNENIEQKLYLHAEMNILTSIINQKDKKDLNLIIKGEIEQFTSRFADSDNESTEDDNFESAMDFGHIVIHSHEI